MEKTPRRGLGGARGLVTICYRCFVGAGRAASPELNSKVVWILCDPGTFSAGVALSVRQRFEGVAPQRWELTPAPGTSHSAPRGALASDLKSPTQITWLCSGQSAFRLPRDTGSLFPLREMSQNSEQEDLKLWNDVTAGGYEVRQPLTCDDWKWRFGVCSKRF